MSSAAKKSEEYSRKRAPFKKKEGPTPIDVSVGQRLRQRRIMLGLSQDAVAKSTGLTFQQIQKYEQGINRVSASRLHQFCSILSVEPNFFFTGLEGALAAQHSHRLSENQSGYQPAADMLDTKETAELIRLYYSIKNAKARKNVLKIIRDMAENLSSQES